MTTTNIDQLSQETLYENLFFHYTNKFATYHISFVQEKEIRSKALILCHIDQLGIAIKKLLDATPDPEEQDLLDLSAVVYDVADFFGDIFFLSSYEIKVDLVELHHSDETDGHVKDDQLELPFLDLKESRKIIKGFSDFR